MKEIQSGICNMAPTHGGIGIENASQYDRRQTIEKSRKERKSDVIGCHTHAMESKDKGKAISIPHNSLATGKLKENQNSAFNSSTLVVGSCQKGLGNLSFSSGSAENVKESNKDKLVSCSHSSGKTAKMKSHLSSSNGALGKKSESGKEIGEKYLSPSTSLVGGAKDRPNFVNITNFLPEKIKGEGKAILKPFNIRESSAAAAVISRPLRKMKTSEKKNNAVGVSSCPPITRTRKLQ